MKVGLLFLTVGELRVYGLVTGLVLVVWGPGGPFTARAAGDSLTHLLIEPIQGHSSPHVEHKVFFRVHIVV